MSNQVTFFGVDLTPDIVKEKEPVLNFKRLEDPEIEKKIKRIRFSLFFGFQIEKDQKEKNQSFMTVVEEVLFREDFKVEKTFTRQIVTSENQNRKFTSAFSYYVIAHRSFVHLETPEYCNPREYIVSNEVRLSKSDKLKDVFEFKDRLFFLTEEGVLLRFCFEGNDSHKWTRLTYNVNNKEHGEHFCVKDGRFMIVCKSGVFYCNNTDELVNKTSNHERYFRYIRLAQDSTTEVSSVVMLGDIIHYILITSDKKSRLCQYNLQEERDTIGNKPTILRYIGCVPNSDVLFYYNIEKLVNPDPNQQGHYSTYLILNDRHISVSGKFVALDFREEILRNNDIVMYFILFTLEGNKIRVYDCGSKDFQPSMKVAELIVQIDLKYDTVRSVEVTRVSTRTLSKFVIKTLGDYEGKQAIVRVFHFEARRIDT